MHIILVPLVSILVGVVNAQGQAWAQCGGNGFSGPTTCVSGYTCNKINDYYSQCVPATTSGASPSSPTTLVTSTSGGSQPSTTIGAGAPGIGENPFAGYELYANSYYASEVISIAIPSGANAAKASAVAKVPSFFWMDTMAKVPVADSLAADARKQQTGGKKVAVPLVVYDLPDRDCAALASNGELSIANDGANKYKQYIDSIVTLIKKYSDLKFILVIEPDSLANMITNLNVAKCANAKQTYFESHTYALKALNLPNVSMYLDAGHAGWLGWPANIGPAAQMYAQVYKDAGSPAAVRGLATNVANFNAFSIANCPAYTQGNQICDEKRYINAISPLLSQNGFNARFITDTGRNGVQPTKQEQWGDWCNVAGTGFGVRPSINTGDSLVDSFVWVKPGGESDGTSNTSAVRYDAHCGANSALKPAPEAGSWFQAYFVQLLTNANPSF